MNDTTETKQILLTRRSPGYWRVTINHPPLNIFGPDTIPELNEAITAVETDEHVKVVVFKLGHVSVLMFVVLQKQAQKRPKSRQGHLTLLTPRSCSRLPLGSRLNTSSSVHWTP